jgi:hypothetical protein
MRHLSSGTKIFLRTDFYKQNQSFAADFLFTLAMTHQISCFESVWLVNKAAWPGTYGFD